MSPRYNKTTATHYSSYRPPLHQLILGRVLTNVEMFSKGLDIGCGTGHSTIALAKYCDHVYGLEPSQSMLDESLSNTKITYLTGTGENIPLMDKSVEVITFAGSLFYAKSDPLIKEIQRVCRRRALAIVYDFELLLDYIILELGIRGKDAEARYTHDVNFSDQKDFTELLIGQEQISFEVAAVNLCHILLSSTDRFEVFQKRYGGLELFKQLLSSLELSRTTYRIKANIYFSKYKLNIE